MRVSFDFDGTLWNGPRWLHEIAMDYVAAGHEVHIVTRRYADPARGEVAQVRAVAAHLGVPDDRVHYTDRARKLDTVLLLDVQLHFDDDYGEVSEIIAAGVGAALAR